MSPAAAMTLVRLIYSESEAFKVFLITRDVDLSVDLTTSTGDPMAVRVADVLRQLAEDLETRRR